MLTSIGVDGSTPKHACIFPCFILLYSDYSKIIKSNQGSLIRIHGKVVPFHMIEV